MNVIIAVNTQQKGFFVSLGHKFEAEGHKVYYLMLKSGLSTYFMNTFNLPAESILDPDTIDISSTLSVIDFEKKYDTTFSNLIAQDRGLGRGYFLNIEKYPNRPDAWLNLEEKLNYIKKEFHFIEYISEKIKPDLVIELFIPVIHNLVFNYNRTPTVGIGPSRYSNNYCLHYNGALQSHLLEDKVDSLLSDRNSMEGYEPFSFEREPIANQAHQTKKWSYFHAFRESLSLIRRELARLRRNKFKQDIRDYYPFAWIPTRFRKISNYNYTAKICITPEQLSNKKIIFYPLHLEPEVALMTVSPEFSNSLEAISWLSKSLPADYILVVKEHPMSFGNRSKAFYKFLHQISNVEIADTNIHSWEWIKKSTMVATITGTVGYEGVFFHKPVISFGKHQIINRLPTVEYVSDYISTKNAFNKLVEINDEETFELSHKALAKAIIDTSFDIPNFNATYKKADLMPEAAEICYDKLIEYLPIAKERLLKNVD